MFIETLGGEKKATKQSQSLEFAAGYWTCTKKATLTSVALLSHPGNKKLHIVVNISWFYAWNVDIFPYKNENFEDSKQRYIFITSDTFLLRFAKQGSVGHLIKIARLMSDSSLVIIVPNLVIHVQFLQGWKFQPSLHLLIVFCVHSFCVELVRWEWKREISVRITLVISPLFVLLS